ncbi:MAG: hypothetical protein KKD44_17710 [Proteobacteria bacterium]|nr:hypothetical protein [Pseudomonadota bacterium]
MKRLVVVERNPHIRSLLEREFQSEGYQVSGAANEHELFGIMDGISRVDLLIIDPEIVENTFSTVWQRIRQCYPDLPVIVHSLCPNPQQISPLGIVYGRVEKNWNSIGELKKVSSEILQSKEC